MYLLQPELHSRRAFLKRSAQLAATGTALPFALNLAAMGEAAAFNATNAPGDYKALVCVFFYGGNDFANTVIPVDNTNYGLYSTIRQGTAGIALDQATMLANSALNPLTPAAFAAGMTQPSFAFNPSMTGLAGLFNTGKAAVQLNVGPLTAPLTRAQYNSSNHALYPRPAQLFSHNDQQSTWQASSPEGAKKGWGGNMGDLALNVNNGGTSSSTFSCMSVTGNAVFLAGDSAVQYQVSSGGQTTNGGAIATNAALIGSNIYGSTANTKRVSDAINFMLNQSRSHALEKEYTTVTKRSMDAQVVVKNAMTLATGGTVPGSTTALARFTTTANETLMNQLRTVAQLIIGRDTLGVKRQVFLVSIGGFDTHDYLIRDHGPLLGKVSAAMTAFYNAMNDLGIADKVTCFTASDFGRTLASNGDGSDHGWGSHHIVVGGAVNGQKFYGTAPPVSVSDAKDSSGVYLPQNQWHVGQGRLLPTTSVDQYGATMAKWFGVTETEMPQVFPNISRFASTYSGNYMGFMQP